MLSQKHRFHGLGSLRVVYQRGKTVRGELINLKRSTRDPRRPYRVAVVVSRKVNKSAVVRNRIRRRVYEAVRSSATTIPGGTDLVLTVFSDHLAELPAGQLQKNIDGLLARALAD